MTAQISIALHSPKYVKTGSNANLSSSQANKAINFVRGFYKLWQS
jgi:hypothetical protein